MLEFSLLLVFTTSQVLAYSITPQMQPGITEELRRNQESLEILGRTIEIPEWIGDVKQFWSETFGGASEKSSRRVSFMQNLKKDESARIMLAIYLNLFVLILVYVFIAFKLLLQSIQESQEDRRKRKTFRSHRSFDGPDYNNLPLASIATRKMTETAPMSVENPLTGFVEMAREAAEESDIYDDDEAEEEQLPATSSSSQNPQYDQVPAPVMAQTMDEESF
ncbi:unnamed protein product [Caenorhabditis angaria]|uniref:Uncharacterized protein n=1 Tax=Caenorhabditis angaria TaxID=860376 RepID=A0A9P1MZN1_9PELO|nr:unnamed protein product [Caenorhabditis angaria]